jgi:hypothetical protein
MTTPVDVTATQAAGTVKTEEAAVSSPLKSEPDEEKGPDHEEKTKKVPNEEPRLNEGAEWLQARGGYAIQSPRPFS